MTVELPAASASVTPNMTHNQPNSETPTTATTQMVMGSFVKIDKISIISNYIYIDLEFYFNNISNNIDDTVLFFFK